MKIGIVNPYSWDVPGGVGFHIRDLALKLRSRGHDVQVLTPSTSDDLPEWITSAGSSIQRIGGQPFRETEGTRADSPVAGR